MENRRYKLKSKTKNSTPSKSTSDLSHHQENKGISEHDVKLESGMGKLTKTLFKTWRKVKLLESKFIVFYLHWLFTLVMFKYNLGCVWSVNKEGGGEPPVKTIVFPASNIFSPPQKCTNLPVREDPS